MTRQMNLIGNFEAVIAYLTIENSDGNKHDIYSGIFESREEAEKALASREGILKLVSAENEEELEKAFEEEVNYSDLEDLARVLKIISRKAYKIDSKRLHKLYDKYSKEFAKQELKKRSDESLINLKDKIECGDLDYDNKIEIKGVALADVDILSIIYDLLEIED